MMLHSEIQKRSEKIRKYLKRNGIIEARFMFDDGSIGEYRRPSELMKALLGNQMYNSKRKRKVKAKEK